MKNTSPKQISIEELSKRSNTWMNYNAYYTFPGIKYALASEVCKVGFGSQNHAETLQTFAPKGMVLMYVTEGGFRTKREAKSAGSATKIIKGTIV